MRARGAAAEPLPVPLRIALDHRPALLSPAGIGRAVRELARALAERDDLDVHLFGHSLAAVRQPDAVPPRAHLHRLPIPGRSLPFLARLGLGADTLAGRPAVFHWTDYVHPPVRTARIVLTVHDLAFARDAAFHGGLQAEVLLARTRAAAARAAAIVTPSQTTADDVRTFLQPRCPVHVVPFGSEHVTRRPRPGPATGAPFALALGTIEPRKNHLRLLQAWRMLPGDRPRLVVVGQPGWECAETVTELQAAAAEGWLTWHRDLDDDGAFALLAQARLLVYPSRWEGFGFPPLEAMALGTPVVAGDCGALRELCGEAAHYCLPTEAVSIAAAVAAVFADDARHAQLAGAGRARAARYSWRTCAEQHAAIYAEAAR